MFIQFTLLVKSRSTFGQAAGRLGPIFARLCGGEISATKNQEKGSYHVPIMLTSLPGRCTWGDLETRGSLFIRSFTQGARKSTLLCPFKEVYTLSG